MSDRVFKIASECVLGPNNFNVQVLSEDPTNRPQHRDLVLGHGNR